MSQSVPEETALQSALREAQEWKTKALATQRAAEGLKQKAQILKERAQLAVDANKDLTVSLRQIRKRAQDLQALAHRLNSEKDAQAEELKNSSSEKLELSNKLAAVEQQLALYQRAMEELNNRTRREDMVDALREAMSSPGLKEELEDTRRRLEESANDRKALELELESRNREIEELRLTLESLAAEREAESRNLASANQKLSELREELDENSRELEDRSQEVETALSRLEETRQTLEEVTGKLHSALQSLEDKEQELQTHEADTQNLVEELYREAETLRSEIEFLATEKLELEQKLESNQDEEAPLKTAGEAEALRAEVEELRARVARLEDERSDLEIVNIDLLQQLSGLGHNSAQ